MFIFSAAKHQTVKFELPINEHVHCFNITTVYASSSMVLQNNIQGTVQFTWDLYDSGSQSGVHGPLGVLPGGPC